MSINIESVKELVNKGLKDSEIAKELNCSKDGVYACRKRNNIERPSFAEAKSILLTDLQINFLIGCILGDGSMSKSKNSKNPRFKCEHGEKQIEYCKWKYSILESLNPNFRISTRKTIDIRTNKFYTSAYVETKANPEFNNIYNLFYNNNKKLISKEIYPYFNELSLAVLFMDDGYKHTHSIGIATNCFNILELENFNDFLFNKFKIKFNIIKENKLYLPKRFYNQFKSLVLPYIHPTMMYKLH